MSDIDKRGRPPKAPEDLTFPLAIRLTVVEREGLRNLAVADGRSLSGYIAQVLRRQPKPRRGDQPLDKVPSFAAGETRQLVIRMTVQERGELQRRANEDGRSLSNHIVHVLRLHLDGKGAEASSLGAAKRSEAD